MQPDKKKMLDAEAIDAEAIDAEAIDVILLEILLQVRFRLFRHLEKYRVW